MTNDVPVYAVITAGGKGMRMGNAIPKQFLDLDGMPVLGHTLMAFMKALPNINIVLVLPPDQISYAQIVLGALPDRIDVTIVPGGETRFHSVKNGLNGLPKDAVIMVHDGVRCLITPDLIQRCYNQALAVGSAIPVVPITDSLRMVNGNDNRAIDRSTIHSVQTPQTFKGEILLPAFEQEYSESFTDEASVVEALGAKVLLIEGEKSNIKITTPEDMYIAQALLKMKAATCE